MGIYNTQNKVKLYLGSKKITNVYKGDEKIYSAGNIVTYHITDTISYMEEIEEGASVLAPSSFSPVGLVGAAWAFLGWRTDKTASSSVLTDKAMGDNPIDLYAVYRLAVTVTYYNNSTSASKTTGYRHYNNGNYANPSFKLTQASRSGWTARGWSTGTAGNSSITYNNATAFTRDSNVTLYGMYQQTITVTYYNNSATASKTTGTRYYNSNGSVTNPSFKLTQAASSGWTARGWSTTNKGNASITYNNGATFTRDSNITLYGLYQRTITLSYAGNGNTGGSTAAQTGTQYWAPAGYINPSFTLRANGFAKTNYTFKGWSTNSSAASGSAANTSVTLSANTTYYAVWGGVAFYVIQNGALVSGNYISAVNNYNGGGHSGYNTDFGYYAHTSSKGLIGPRVAFNTKGCRNLRVIVTNYVGRASDATLTATGSIGTQKLTELVSSKTYTGTVTRDTSAFVQFLQDEDVGTWVEATIKEIYLYD